MTNQIKVGDILIGIGQFTGGMTAEVLEVNPSNPANPVVEHGGIEIKILSAVTFGKWKHLTPSTIEHFTYDGWDLFFKIKSIKRHAGNGWATGYIQKLNAGETIQCRPKGNSMQGRIESGQLCTIEPLNVMPSKNDIVLCKVKSTQFLHLVTAIKDNRIQISNNKNYVNGWIGLDSVYGKLIKVEP